MLGMYSKFLNLCKTAALKGTKHFQDQLSRNAGHKYYSRMLQGEHSAILLTFIKLPVVVMIFVLSIFERPFYTDLTVSLFFSRVTMRSLGT